jgi:alpha-beta hydrolase superfamily lysophospholipase
VVPAWIAFFCRRKQAGIQLGLALIRTGRRREIALHCGDGLKWAGDRVETSSFIVTAADGVELFVYRWQPSGPPRAAIQIAHGLAEHAGRYARLAEALTGAGYAVYGSDHRGHGKTAKSPEDLGFFAASDGWAKCVEDLWQVNRRIAAEHSGLPLILVAHSMGSFLAQNFIAEHGDALAGVVLSGSNGKPPAAAIFGKAIARLERLRLGRRGRSALLDRLGFGAFNKPFEPSRTPFDWLSRDPAEVDRYIADPLCGGASSTQLWIDLLGGLSRIARPALQRRIPKALPIHLIAGGRDPVTGNTKGLEQLIGAYRAAGLNHLSHRFYAGARHELFNETNRDEVTADLINWLGELRG